MLADVASGKQHEYAPIPTGDASLSGRALGVDIGGTGIKAAVVDVGTGQLVSERVREVTPRPATPTAVLRVVGEIAARLEATGELTPDLPAGVGFPSAVRAGRALTATNLDPAWIGASVEDLFGAALRRPTRVLNDADAAGVAELAYGAGKGERGTVLLLDLGTGIGSALLAAGQLVPNLQLGHVALRGRDAETLVSPAARVRRGLGWKRWAREFNELLALYETYLWPDLIILGGGSSADFPSYGRHLETHAPLVVAGLGNLAGIVGAARVGAGPASER
jgi:polyphosphate glucokinase